MSGGVLKSRDLNFSDLNKVYAEEEINAKTLVDAKKSNRSSVYIYGKPMQINETLLGTIIEGIIQFY
jgi:hypothetical protein